MIVDVFQPVMANKVTSVDHGNIMNTPRLPIQDGEIAVGRFEIAAIGDIGVEVAIDAVADQHRRNHIQTVACKRRRVSGWRITF